MTHSLVFVYGTLKRGQRNYPFFMKSAHFVGEAVTATADYAMHCNGRFPLVTDCPGGSRVRGELYAVDRRTLRRLDQLEGHPDFYRRRLRLFHTQVSQYRAWVYVVPSDRLSPAVTPLVAPPLEWSGPVPRTPLGRAVACGDVEMQRRIREALS